MLRSTVFATLAAALSFTASVHAQAPLTTAFNYQGELQHAGMPAVGPHDFQFAVFDSVGTQRGSTICLNDVDVAAGRFSVSLDFGDIFTGAQLFLEIRVRDGMPLDCSDPTGFTTLTPRQELKATPYAWHSNTATNAETASIALQAGSAIFSSNANQLGNQPPAFYTNASNINAGTISDLRLSNNVLLSNASQLISANHTFADGTLQLRGTNGLFTTILRADQATVARDIRLPDASGTIPVAASAPINLSATGLLSLSTVPVALGGTGSTTAAGARTNLDAASLSAPNLFTGLNGFNNSVAMFAPAPSAVPLQVNGAASQTANLQEWTVNGAPRANIGPTGTFTTIGALATSTTVNTPSISFTDGSVQTRAAKMLRAVANLNVPNMTSGNGTTMTVTVTGAALGDTVVVSPGADLGSALIAWARVSAANTVAIRFHNPTFGGIDPAAMDYFIVVLQQ